MLKEIDYKYLKKPLKVNNVSTEALDLLRKISKIDEIFVHIKESLYCHYRLKNQGVWHRCNWDLNKIIINNLEENWEEEISKYLSDDMLHNCRMEIMSNQKLFDRNDYMGIIDEIYDADARIAGINILKWYNKVNGSIYQYVKTFINNLCFSIIESMEDFDNHKLFSKSIKRKIMCVNGIYYQVLRETSNKVVLLDVLRDSFCVADNIVHLNLVPKKMGISKFTYNKIIKRKEINIGLDKYIPHIRDEVIIFTDEEGNIRKTIIVYNSDNHNPNKFHKIIDIKSGLLYINGGYSCLISVINDISTSALHSQIFVNSSAQDFPTGALSSALKDEEINAKNGIIILSEESCGLYLTIIT